MSGWLGGRLGDSRRHVLTAVVCIWALFQLFRLVSAERPLLGGALSLPLDDSFIYLQYSRAVAEGHPFVYTPGNATDDRIHEPLVPAPASSAPPASPFARGLHRLGACFWEPGSTPPAPSCSRGSGRGSAARSAGSSRWRSSGRARISCGATSAAWRSRSTPRRSSPPSPSMSGSARRPIPDPPVVALRPRGGASRGRDPLRGLRALDAIGIGGGRSEPGMVGVAFPGAAPRDRRRGPSLPRQSRPHRLAGIDQLPGEVDPLRALRRFKSGSISGTRRSSASMSRPCCSRSWSLEPRANPYPR